MASNELKVRFTGDTSGLKKATKKAQGQLNGFNKSVGKLGGMVAGAFAIGAIVNFTRESVKLASTIEGVERRFKQLNGTNLSTLQRATRGTVDNLSLMRAAVQAKNFKIPLENLGKFFQFATQRAVETGESVDHLVNSIVLGVGRKSPLILDNLGISAVELRKKLKGAGAEASTVADVAAAMSEIIDEAAVEFGGLGLGVLTSSQKLAQADVAFKDLSQTIGELITGSGAIEFFTVLAQNIASAATSLDDIVENDFIKRLSEGSARGSKQFQEYIKTLKGVFGEAFDLEGAQQSYLEQLKITQKRLNEDFINDSSKGNNEQRKFINDEVRAIEELIATQKLRADIESDINFINEEQYKTLDKLDLSLKKVSASEGILGTDFTRTKDRISLYQQALISLIAGGLDPASDKAKELSKQLRIQQGLLKEAPEPLTGAPGAPTGMGVDLPQFQGGEGGAEFGGAITTMSVARVKALELQQTMQSAAETVGFTVGNIANEFSALFSGMLQEGNLTFKGLLIGLSKIIAKLLIAAGVSAALKLLLTGDSKGVSTAVASAASVVGNLASSIIPGAAEGGITTGATLAMVGEGKEQEAILPLSKLASLMGGFGVNSRQGSKGSSHSALGVSGGGGGSLMTRLSGSDLLIWIDRSQKMNART